MLRERILSLIVICTLSACATVQESSNLYQLNSCYVGPLNFEKEGAANLLTICMKKENRITTSLRYSNESLLHGKIDKPTTCYSKGQLKPKENGVAFTIITENGKCTNGRSFNSYLLECESKNSNSITCRNDQLPNAINLTRES